MELDLDNFDLDSIDPNMLKIVATAKIYKAFVSAIQNSSGEKRAMLINKSKKFRPNLIKNHIVQNINILKDSKSTVEDVENAATELELMLIILNLPGKII